jgi:hypothetical protein
MEIGRSNIIIAYVRLCLVGLIVIMQLKLGAQTAVGSYTIKNGRMYIEMNKQADGAQMDKFLIQYNLSDLPLKQFIQTNSRDSLVKLGWKIEKNNQQAFIISKRVMPLKEINNPADKIIFTEKHPTFAELFPAVNNGLLYGNNRFRNKSLFAVANSTVTFFLRGYLNATRVMLAGSFNDWSPGALQMTKKENGWVADVKLSPGKYWYKFIVDYRWMVDDDNLLSENDGLGNINSVYFKPNAVFVLDGFADAKKVFVAGSFNNWHERELQMIKTPSGWQLPLYLGEGTHTYKFIVDGRWLIEEKKQARLPDGHGGYNSVLEIGKPHLFTLNGYTNAGRVILSGNFNGWRTDELFMQKTNNGWQLPYVIGAGNYEYKFIVDGNWITDPANPLTVDNEGGTKNSYLIIDPNYTFRLKGYADAQSVFLAGDFNNWSPKTLAMKRDGDDWVFSVHLFAGKHLYKFIVDGSWIIDPSNKLWEENEYGTGNSILWIDK